jgi:type IV pilus assembly protein PilN
MIKINLSAAQKQVDISNLGGFDFTKLKIKAVLLACVLIYLPDIFLVSVWEDEFNTKNQELTELQSKSVSLKRKVSQSSTLEKQIRELKAQEENLGKKLTAVKQAISQKRNPANLLLYVSKHMPEDLWIKELVIDGETMLIKGDALSYNSVGNFVNNLRSSIFIKDSNIKGTTSAVRASDKRRIESFEISFVLARLE